MHFLLHKDNSWGAPGALGNEFINTKIQSIFERVCVFLHWPACSLYVPSEYKLWTSSQWADSPRSESCGQTNNWFCIGRVGLSWSTLADLCVCVWVCSICEYVFVCMHTSGSSLEDLGYLGCGWLMQWILMNSKAYTLGMQNTFPISYLHDMFLNPLPFYTTFW